MATSFWSSLRPKGGLAGVIYRAKQAAAGALESTVANSAYQNERGVLPGSRAYRPAIIDQPLTLVGVLSTLAGQNVDPNSLVGSAMRRSRLASVRTNDTLGIRDPENTGETVLRIGGSLIVPGPKTGVIGKAAVGASRAEKIARGAGRLATEIALPLRQTGVKGAAAATAVGTGLVEGVNKIAPIQGYEGIGDTDDKDELEFDRALQPSSTDEEQALNQTIVSEDESTFDAQINADLDATEEQQKLATFENAGLLLGTALGGYATMRYMRGRATKALEEGAEQARERFTGKQFIRSRGGTAQRIKTAVARADQPIRDIVDETLAPDRAAKFGHKLDLMNNVSIGAKLRDQFLTGRLVGTDQRTVRLAPVADAWAKELTPDEQLQVSDALLAASALDDFRSTGVLSSMNKSRDGATMAPIDLDRMVQAVRQNPKLSKYFDAVQQSYRDKLKYELSRGLISQAEYNKLIQRRPNYVEMSRNLEPDADPFSQERKQFSANKVLGASRSADELGGVQGTSGIANPFHSLFGSWGQTVRNAELNDIRANVLKEVSQNSPTAANGKPLVQQLPRGQKPYKMENVHQVFENGEVVNYRVLDPHLNKALHFAPRATAGMLEHTRQWYQGLTTGPIASMFNLFSFMKSPVYDTTMGLLLRPRGFAAPGLINEATGLNLPDPTSLLGAYTGAVRYMWDDLRGNMAKNVSSQMFRENSWLRNLLGDNNVATLEQSLQASYEASIKSELDRLGAASHTLHGSPDPSKVATGLEDIVPSFNRSAMDQLNRDIADAALKGDIGPVKALMLRSKNRIASSRSTAIASAYQGVMEAMHNGFRYQGLATNRSRIPDVERIGSNLRRLSADAAQHGGHDTTNKVLGSFMYANLGVQSLYELGKMIRNDPVRAMTNISSVVGTLVALHYGALASDPKALEQHSKKSAEQKLTSLTSFEGMEIPIDPVARLFVASMFPVLDHVSGASNGEWNPDFLETIDNWLQSPEEQEQFWEDQQTSLLQAARQNNPIDPTAQPVMGAVMAQMGIDPGMSRITGEASLVQPQKISGFDPEASQPDSIGSAYTQNMIAALFSSTGRSMYQMVDDMYRAYGQTGTLEDAAKVAKSRYKDTAYKGSALARPLFGQYETMEGLKDTNFALMKDRRKGVDAAINVYRKNIVQPTTTGTDVRYSEFIPQEEGVIPPELRGTELELIASRATALDKNYLSKYRANLADLSEKNKNVQGSYLRTVEQRNKMSNEITAERKHLNMLMLEATRRYEHMISQELGKPFRFDDFNPDDFKQPLGQ